jgi:hypothetical protein
MHTGLGATARVEVLDDFPFELRVVLIERLIDYCCADAFSGNALAVQPADAKAGVHCIFEDAVGLLGGWKGFKIGPDGFLVEPERVDDLENFGSPELAEVLVTDIVEGFYRIDGLDGVP